MTTRYSYALSLGLLATLGLVDHAEAFARMGWGQSIQLYGAGQPQNQQQQHKRLATSRSSSSRLLAKVKSTEQRKQERLLRSRIENKMNRRLKRINWDKIEEEVDDEYTLEEAQTSAGIYMSPATENVAIAADVKISWEREAADTIRQLARISNPNRPLMVGVVGIPGSGKSTSCDILASLLGANSNGANSSSNHSAAIIPMDGYHYSLADLSKFPNPADVIYRRGAPDTFDVSSLSRDLERIAYGSQSEIKVPAFDHAHGDPIEDGHTFTRDANDIVICEGIYLLYDQDGWEAIQNFFDWTIFIQADVDACIERLKERNKVIPGYTPEEIEARCDDVDRSNCLLAQDSAAKYASQIVKTVAL